MERIKVNTLDYYGKPAYYSVMPLAIFETLEQAFLSDEEFVELDRNQLETMLADYKAELNRQIV